MDNDKRIRQWLKNRPGPSSADQVDTQDDDFAALLAEAGGDGKDGKPPLPSESDDRNTLQGDEPAAAALPSGIDRVRAEIDRRRHRHRKGMLRKIALVAGIPLALIVTYAGLFATPLYTGDGAFTVQTEGDSGGAQPTAGLIALPGNSSTITDAFKARTFILSRPMMMYMEKEHGFMSHFDEMDIVTRPGGAIGGKGDPLAYYRKRVKVMIDIQDGIVRLEVDARTPEDAQRFGNAILTATERHVNAMSDRIAVDQISGLTKRADEAEKALTDSRIALGRVRSRKGEVSPEQSASVLYGLISNLELQLAEAKGKQSALLDDGLVDSPLLPPLNARIDELKSQIRENRARISNPGGIGSLAQTAGAFETATIAQEIALGRWQNMLEVLQQAYLQTLSDRRYVVPVVPISSNAIPAVKDWWSIARFMLILCALLGGIIYALHRSGKLPERITSGKIQDLMKQWK